jgi:hypothetical protein
MVNDEDSDYETTYNTDVGGYGTTYNGNEPAPYTVTPTGLGSAIQYVGKADSMPPDDYRSGPEGAAKFFGFMRNKWDVAVDDWKAKAEISDVESGKFMNGTPDTLKGGKVEKFVSSLGRGLAKGELAAQRFGQAIGGGAPQVGYPQPVMDPYGYKPIPASEYGSQQPKYQAYPVTAEPGSTWVREQYYDRYGKKRSRPRKARVPGVGTPVPGYIVPSPPPGVSPYAATPTPPMAPGGPSWQQSGRIGEPASRSAFFTPGAGPGMDKINALIGGRSGYAPDPTTALLAPAGPHAGELAMRTGELLGQPTSTMSFGEKTHMIVGPEPQNGQAYAEKVSWLRGTDGSNGDIYTKLGLGGAKETKQEKDLLKYFK